MTGFNTEFTELFRDETMRRLEEMDNMLLAIESGDAGADAVNSLFRHAHTIKGAAGMLAGADAPQDGFWQMQVMGQFGSRIGGGTNEVHRNMIGERALGLPAEPRSDKDVPWRDLARS